MGVRGSGEGKCEGKKTTLTLTLTPFITVCQPVTAKSEGVRVKNKKFFQPYSSKSFFVFFTLTIPAGKHTACRISMDGRQIQWTGCKKAALYRQYTYAAPLVQGGCTVGARVLHFSGTAIYRCLQ